MVECAKRAVIKRQKRIFTLIMMQEKSDLVIETSSQQEKEIVEKFEGGIP